ncbi:MAG: hypothetical protein AB7S75_19285 [Desulfococcaceae bacterium]
MSQWNTAADAKFGFAPVEGAGTTAKNAKIMPVDKVELPDTVYLFPALSES